MNKVDRSFIYLSRDVALVQEAEATEEGTRVRLLTHEYHWQDKGEVRHFQHFDSSRFRYLEHVDRQIGNHVCAESIGIITPPIPALKQGDLLMDKYGQYSLYQYWVEVDAYLVDAGRQEDEFLALTLKHGPDWIELYWKSEGDNTGCVLCCTDLSDLVGGTFELRSRSQGHVNKSVVRVTFLESVSVREGLDFEYSDPPPPGDLISRNCAEQLALKFIFADYEKNKRKKAYRDLGWMSNQKNCVVDSRLLYRGWNGPQSEAEHFWSVNIQSIDWVGESYSFTPGYHLMVKADGSAVKSDWLTML